MNTKIERRPMLTPEHRAELAGFGATPAQIDAIAGELHGLAVELRGPWPARDVSDSLDELVALTSRLSSMMTTTLSDGPDGQAWRLMKLQIVEAGLDGLSAAGLRGIDTPEAWSEVEKIGLQCERLDGFVKLMSAAAAAAKDGHVSARARGRPRANGAVVQFIIDALRTPKDAKSVAFADACRPILGRHASANRFPDVLRVVVEAATGVRPGRVGAYVAAWSRSEFKWPDGTPDRLRRPPGN